MKKIMMGLLVMSSMPAFAMKVSIDSVTIVRSGGGQLESLVYVSSDSKIHTFTKTCNFKKLSSEQQFETEFTLTGVEAEEMQIILDNKAILASDESITHPRIPTGTWGSIEVDYQYEVFDGSMKADKKKISNPLVFIESKMTDVLSRVETLIRAKNKNICN